MPDLSVLIPARQERFLRRTVEDVLANSRADTEVIVVLDGAWADPPLEQHPKVTVIHQPVSIGQRAATNLAARLSQARYVMKLDAHCALDEGFDAKLITAAQELGEDVTQIPAQYNLHVHDWVCEACGARTYQAPPLTACATCGGPVRIEMVWQPRRSRLTTAWRLDPELHFQYHGQGQRQQQGPICDVMTSLGACFFMTRARFWALGGLDEAAGSWGQFGQEIACKSWLSGGRHVVNKSTWFAHFFRVGGIGFPYPISGSEQDRARKYHRDLWLQNRWPGQVRPLSWLVDKFAPLPGWHDPTGAEALAAVRAAGEAFSRPAPALAATHQIGVVYYTDNRLEPAIAEACQRQLRRATNGWPIATVALQPIDFGDVRLVLPKERGYLTMFEQILEGLEALDTELVFFAEHDVLYAPEHFTFRPAEPGTIYYNPHVWKVDAQSGRCLHYRCNQTSGLCASRAVLLAHYRRRVARVAAEGFRRSIGFEPGTRSTRIGGIDDLHHATWWAERPNVDIRHRGNLTPSRWRKDQFRDQRYTAGWTEAEEIPGWGRPFGRFGDWLQEVTA